MHSASLQSRGTTHRWRYSTPAMEAHAVAARAERGVERGDDRVALLAAHVTGREVDHAAGRVAVGERDEVAAVRDLVGTELDAHRRGLDRRAAGVVLGGVVSEDRHVADVAARRQPVRDDARPADLRLARRAPAGSEAAPPRAACVHRARRARHRRNRRERTPRTSWAAMLRSGLAASAMRGRAQCRTTPTYAPPMRKPLLVVVVVACVLGACSSSKQDRARRRPATRDHDRRADDLHVDTDVDDRQARGPELRRRADQAHRDRDRAREAGRRSRRATARARSTSPTRSATSAPSRAASSLPHRVLDLRGQVSDGNEQGLLGLTFSPDGTQLYVDFTDTDRRHARAGVRDEGRRRRRRVACASCCS